LIHGPAIRLGLLFFFTYAYFIQRPSWNPNSRFDLVRALVERGRVDIDPYHHNTGDKAFARGHHFSDKAPGAAFFAVIPYAVTLGVMRATGSDPPQSVVVGRDGVMEPARARGDGEDDVVVSPSYRVALAVCALFTSGLAGALAVASLFTRLVARGFSAGDARLGALALGGGSLWFPYATMFYGHVLAGSLAFIAFALVDGHAGGRVSVARFLGAGALGGAAVVCELPVAIVVAAVAVFARARGAARGFVWFVAATVAPLAGLAVYNAAAFGDPFVLGYERLARADFAAGMSHGVLGVGLPRPDALLAILAGRSRGLLWTAPVLLLGFVGFFVWLRGRTRDAAALTAAAVVVAFLLFNAGYFMWWGGHALGPRHFIPALPFLCLAIPWALPRAPGRGSRSVRRLAWALLAVSVANMLLATAVGPEAPPTADVLLDHVYTRAVTGNLPPPGGGTTNLGRLAGLPGGWSLAPLAALWLVPLSAWMAPDRPLQTRARGSDEGTPP
jgi:hypothetical protein